MYSIDEKISKELLVVTIIFLELSTLHIVKCIFFKCINISWNIKDIITFLYKAVVFLYIWVKGCLSPEATSYEDK